MNLFGKKKQKPVPKLSDSIMKLREASANLDKRQEFLVKKSEEALTEAKKKSKAKDKRGALFHLKRKKMYEKQIDQIYGKKTNIETQIMALEGASSNKEVITAMKEGATILQATVSDLNVDKVDEVMDDITDSMAMADELSDAIAQPIGPAVDEDELSAELAEMESEMMDEDLLAAPSVPAKTIKGAIEDEKESDKVIAKPSAAPAKKTLVVEGGGSVSSGGGGGKLSKEEQELRELAASMGMA